MIAGVSLGVAVVVGGAVLATRPASPGPAAAGSASAGPAAEPSAAPVSATVAQPKAAEPATESAVTASTENEIKASGPSKFTDVKAKAYFQSRWKDSTAKRIRDIRTTGRYLRIYTNLTENANNSKAAITLCERGLEYLAEQGERNPVVFVQGRYGPNGNPVLANVLGPGDRDCRVTHPKPR